MKRYIALFFVILLSFSCKTKETLDRDLSWFITDEIQIELLPPALSGEVRSIQQYVQGRYGKEEYSMMAVVILEEESIFIQGLTPLGSSLFEISYGADRVDFKGNSLFPKDTALYVLADYQLCYYPAEVLEKHLSPHDLHFEETFDGADWKRTISLEGETLITIERKGSQIIFHNLLRDYSYNIEEADFS
ncbi:MAG: DUF3261 domain-containing protein [Spirochaetales bacterium]|nr:DUF3261 domain-containing protein [Spirochaetales bacterium]